MSRYRQRQQHGLSPLLKGRVGLPLDGPAAEALAAWRSDLVADLGGEDGLSAQRLTLIELAVRQRWLLDQVDTFLFQGSVINRRKRDAFPLLKTRQTLSDGLARLLSQLGLDRATSDVDPLQDYLATKAGGTTP